MVLQSLWPDDKLDLNQSAYRIPSDKEIRVAVLAYNFGEQPAQGQLRVQAAEGWTAALDSTVTINPMGRQELVLAVKPPHSSGSSPAKFCVRGAFGSAGEATLCRRLLAGEPTSPKAQP